MFHAQQLKGAQLLPTGTVTLLLADIESSTQLWETQADEMTVAIGRLDQVLADLVVTHSGTRPVEQGEGDSFVLAFTSASDAAKCAVDLQRRPLAPIRLRIGLHTGQVQLRDDDNYIGPTINKAARLRDLACGGQTVLSGATEMLVADFLPACTWLIDLGSYELRGVSRIERVVQLCHRELHNEFPPLKAAKSTEAGRLPVHLTSFVGHRTEIDQVRQLIGDNRLVTLTGAGGVGKTRFAIEVAYRLEAEFSDHVSFVDLAPITSPDLVPVAMGRALGLPDQPARCMPDAIVRFVGDRSMAIVLDNCEHVLNACATLITGLLGPCPRLRLLATSREPISVAGEITWRVPSLSLDHEALDLFADRACRARSDFRMTDRNIAVIKEICRRLDGMPLAIELAAARVRAFSPEEILDSLHDRFRLLTGGARTAMRRQQTLRASVDWSHELLTEAERVLFRRLAVFMGGFDLSAAEAVAAGTDVERCQISDQLALLVDKSLVVAENDGRHTRYRLLETVRQYALAKLTEFGEADTLRLRHRDYYTAMAASLDEPSAQPERIAKAGNENDNLRAAFVWSHEHSDTAAALQLASSLQPLWLTRGHICEGLAWLESVLRDDKAQSAAPAVWARALAAKGTLLGWIGIPGSVDEADHALGIARDIGDKNLLARVLIARGSASLNESDSAKPYLVEAASIAREMGDRRMLSHTLVRLANTAVIAGDPGGSTSAAATEALRAADAIGHQFLSRQCRWVLGWVSTSRGDLAEALAGFRTITDEATPKYDAIILVSTLAMEAHVRAYQGDGRGARASADAAMRICVNLAESYEAVCQGATVVACLADGDATSALRASEVIKRRIQDAPAMSGCFVWSALAPLAFGDLATARHWADEAVSLTNGWYAATALCVRARVEIAQGDLDRAEHDTHKALAIAAGARGYVVVPYLLECTADLANAAGSSRDAATLLGAADAAWKRMDSVRFKILNADHFHFVALLRNILGINVFEEAWANGAALSTEGAIAYAQHRSGEHFGLVPRARVTE